MPLYDYLNEHAVSEEHKCMWSVSGHQVGEKFLTHNMRSIILRHDPVHLGQCFVSDTASGDIL